MSDGAAFDFYDERWYDCWIAATSATRSRKRHIDVNIQERIGRLIEDFGPESERPLTLRIYGMMVKGFCVINNERARALFCDCERVVLMFARQPYTDGDTKIRLPAAKRPRMEAALTLDIDLAKIEASEAFDWTQAPLEEGALLRLGGGDLPQETLPMSNRHEGVADSIDMMPQLLPGAADDAKNCMAMMLSNAQDVGWLPSLGEVFCEPPAPNTLDVCNAPWVASIETGGGLATDMMPPPGHPPEPIQIDGTVAVPAIATDPVGTPAVAVPAKVKELIRRRETLNKPGVVYGFDEESMVQADVYECWQQDSTEFSSTWRRASMYAQDMDADPDMPDQLGPHLRLLVDPPDSTFQNLKRPHPVAPAVAAVGQLPEVQDLLSAGGPVGMDSIFAAPPEAAAGTAAVEPHLSTAGFVASEAVGATLAIEQPLPPQMVEPTEMIVRSEGGAAAEAQDDRTAEVGAIIRGCLRSGGLHSAAFHELVPPGIGGADRATAARSFAAILALASAGEFYAEQIEPYGSIQISEVS